MASEENQKKAQAPQQQFSPAEGDGFTIVVRGDSGPTPAAPLAVPANPLEEFFYREDEPGSPLLELGVAAHPTRVTGARDEARREYLAFLLGSEEYGIEIGNVREIVKPPTITEVPRAAPHILGVVTVRGEVIAVIDPRQRLKLPPGAPTNLARVIVCDVGEGSCGLLVDMVSEVIRLPPSAIEPRPQSMNAVDTEYMAGIGRDGDRMIILLDADLLLRRRKSAEESLT